ncbi:MAG TPA: MFS transporter [Candidatus Bathyarchaeia archaeon]|nr:MFS transporter [Candidatus Bathyarchaeia archaeon]
MDKEEPQQTNEKLLRILAFTLAITLMSATMFNLVLPEITIELQLSLTQASWITSGFLLVYAIGTVMYGKLADHFKLKHLLTFGFTVFTVGSLIGLFAHAFWLVLLGRILQAVGAAVVPAAASIIPIRYFSPDKRGRAMGIAMTGLAIGSAIGPIVASLVVSILHWRWLFCMPLLILLTLPYYRKYLQEDEKKAGSMDWIGGGLLAGMLALLLLAITKGEWLLLVACVILLFLFIIRIHFTKEPFVQPQIFRNKAYSIGLSLAFFVTAAGYSLPFLSPQLLFHLHHLPQEAVGFAMVPAAVLSAIFGRKGGKLADVKGNAYLFFVASGLLGSCFLLMSLFTDISPLLIVLFLILGNLGQTFMMIALSHTLSRTLPQEQIGVGMGFLSMMNFIAGAVSAGVYSRVVDHGMQAQWLPMPMNPDTYVYSNIYVVLLVIHVSILVVHYFQFRERTMKHEYTAN